VRIDHFAITREDDPAGRPHAAQPVGTGEALSAAESVGIVGGHPAPAPAAAAPEPVNQPDADDMRAAAADPFVALGPGEAAMDRFVADYLQLLDGRLDTIRRCLDDSDIEGARVAVMSLESSSLMLGGGSLAACLGELRARLDLGPTPQRNALVALVEAAASVFRGDLQAGRG
jgi:hypothetical protein